MTEDRVTTGRWDLMAQNQASDVCVRMGVTSDWQKRQQQRACCYIMCVRCVTAGAAAKEADHLIASSGGGERHLTRGFLLHVFPRRL